MKMTISLDLKPLKAMQKKLKTLETTSVEVGFFPEDQYGPENENLPVAAVAFMQQKGAKSYPRRPFFDETLEDKEVINHLVKSMGVAARSILEGKGHVAPKLLQIGEYLKYEVMYSIEKYPGHNSPTWADFKGKDDPLSYTDKMLNSVKVKIKK